MYRYKKGLNLKYNSHLLILIHLGNDAAINHAFRVDQWILNLQKRFSGPNLTQKDLQWLNIGDYHGDFGDVTYADFNVGNSIRYLIRSVM